MPTFSSCPRHPASDVSLPTCQPEDSGLAPPGFLMLDLSGDRASSSTHKAAESLISFHCSGLLSGLKNDLFFWAVLFLSHLISKHHPGPGEILDALFDNLGAMEIQGTNWAPLVHGHAPLSLLPDCCSSVPHQLAGNLPIFSTLGSPNFKFLKKLPPILKFFLKDSYIF